MADGLLNKASIILTPTGYKAGTLYNVAPIDEPYEDFDFARTSTATRINSSGLVSNVATGVPRISYDSNGDNGHILLEPTSTNLVGLSEFINPSQPGWTELATNTYTNNYSTAPDGNQTSTRVQFVNPNSSSQLYYLFNSTSGEYSASIYAKGSGTLKFGFYDNASILTDEITLTSEWQRFEVTKTLQTTFGARFWIYPEGASAATDIEIWGAQAEALSYATSYIPTLTGSTETRATETATGAGSADLINSTEGVLYAEIAALADDGTDRKISLNDGTNDNQIVVGFSRFSGNINAEIFYNGNLQSSGWGATSVTQNNLNKFALSWQNGNYKFFYNGVKTVDQSISNTPSGLNQVKFSYGNNTQPMFCECKALAVFNEALSDSELTQLTT